MLVLPSTSCAVTRIREPLFLTLPSTRYLTPKASETSFKLKDTNWNDIFSYTKKVLQKAIKNNGTTLSDMTYVLPQGVYGNNQNNLYIYSKDKCFSCLQKIDKIFIDSRATYVCKKCQKQIN